ncbi:hypothetical protein [Thermithiobacillus plumbiphilus]|uniref:Uncharacterized protein n=1 Tax=Thermithiobacillus plumbiphilus TaxID=1729899 RepID=A0ABU9D8I6_9PROT
MKRILLLAAALLFGSAPVLAAGDDLADAQKVPRLKYRSSGPVCSCISGMSEADISRGRKKLPESGSGADDGKWEASKDSGLNEKEKINEVR